jgi:hypothetical protein
VDNKHREFRGGGGSRGETSKEEDGDASEQGAEENWLTMKALIWNIRGVSNLARIIQFRETIIREQVEIVGL